MAFCLKTERPGPPAYHEVLYRLSYGVEPGS